MKLLASLIALFWLSVAVALVPSPTAEPVTK
jgi:hypothetical protein